MKKFSLQLAPLGFLLVIILLVFSQFSCKSPTAPSSSLSLTAADVVCTEVWLKLDFADSPTGGNYEITRDGNIVLSGNLSNADTVLVDTTVLPSNSYTYIAYRMQNSKTVEQSSPLHITTLDSTSSSFSWHLYKFGDFNATGMPSMLYGIAAVNDSDIWAVGEIYTSDSVGKYNAIHWDVTKWSLNNIYYNYQGQKFWNPIKWIFANTSNDIWFGNSVHWNGKDFENANIGNSIFFGIGTNALWSNQNGQLYAIGGEGKIAFSPDNGNTWNNIISGTSMGFFDINSNNGNNIYVCGGSYQNYDGILLEGDKNGFHTIADGKSLGNSSQLFNPYFDGVARTVWVCYTGTVFFAGNWLYRYTAGQISFVKSLHGNYWGGNTSGQYWGFLSQIRGLAENQMVLVGERNTIRYFNGIRWTQLGMPYDSNSNYTWLSVGITNDIIVVVGYTINPTNGIIMMLKRQ